MKKLLHAPLYCCLSETADHIASARSVQDKAERRIVELIERFEKLPELDIVKLTAARLTFTKWSSQLRTYKELVADVRRLIASSTIKLLSAMGAFSNLMMSMSTMGGKLREISRKSYVNQLCVLLDAWQALVGSDSLRTNFKNLRSQFGQLKVELASFNGASLVVVDPDGQATLWERRAQFVDGFIAGLELMASEEDSIGAS